MRRNRAFEKACLAVDSHQMGDDDRASIGDSRDSDERNWSLADNSHKANALMSENSRC